MPRVDAEVILKRFSQVKHHLRVVPRQLRFFQYRDSQSDLVDLVQQL